MRCGVGFFRFLRLVPSKISPYILLREDWCARLLSCFCVENAVGLTEGGRGFCDCNFFS